MNLFAVTTLFVSLPFIIVYSSDEGVNDLNQLDELDQVNEANVVNNNNEARIISLSNKDFVDGTFIIRESNVLVKLMEDIVFNPRSNYKTHPNEEGAYTCISDDINNYPGCDNSAGSFRLGFFSAISIEANDVNFDLNGFKISLHKEFHIQQRFFALIGVGKGPYINGQGPVPFGDNINVKNIKIHNGHLGLTSHHGIHGNFIDNLEIYDLVIDDFEVAGIQINGFNDVYIHDVDIGPNLRTVPVKGRYSQARFGLVSYRQMLKRLKKLSVQEIEQNYSIEFVDRPGQSITAIDIIERLIKGMNLYFNYKVNGKIPKLNTNDYYLFEDALNTFDNYGDPEGSALYGILLNSAGVAVNWFGSATTDYSQDATIENVNIRDLNLRVQEIVSYVTQAGVVTTGPFGGALPMELLLNLDEYNAETFDLSTDSMLNYNGNILSDAQIALALFGEGKDELEANTLDTEVIGWSQGKNGLKNGYLICNGDETLHMDKGVIGIRVDRTEYVEISNVNIRNINNWSKLGSKFCNYNNDHSYHTHPDTPVPINDNNNQQISNYKYQGRVSRGIALTDVSSGIELKNVVVDKITSSKGSAIGIDLLGSTEYEVDLASNIIISNILSCNGMNKKDAKYLTSDESFPNNNVVSCSIMNENDLVSFNHKHGLDLTINNVEGPFVCTQV